MRRTGKTITMYEGMIPSLLSGLDTFIVGEKVETKPKKEYGIKKIKGFNRVVNIGWSYIIEKL